MSQNDSQKNEQKNSDQPEKFHGEIHIYDGIVEHDNRLPRWWLNGFYLTILFSIGYFFHYTFGDGPNLVAEYDQAKARQENELLASGAMKETELSESQLRSFVKDSVRLAAGKQGFQSKCNSCHGNLAEGGIGPNLTDNYWIHGGKMSKILAVIKNGVADKGMPPWGALLKKDELIGVVSYVKSLRGTGPTGAKAPQGELEKDDN